MSFIKSIDGVFHSLMQVEHHHKSDNHLGEKPKKHTRTESVSNLYKKNEKQKKHRSNIFAYQIMSSKIHSIQKEISVSMAMNYMIELKIHHLIILENNKVWGIISDRDLLQHIHNENSHKLIVDQIMKKEVILCREETEIKMIAKTMIDHTISSIIVINDKDELKGVITKTDLLQCIVNNMPLDIWI